MIVHAILSHGKRAPHDRMAPFVETADWYGWLRSMITGSKISNELRSFLATAAYLYTCYGLLLLYKAMLLHDRGIDFAPYGLAAAKALLLAKFMLIGDKIHLGAKIRGRTVIHLIIRKSAFFSSSLSRCQSWRTRSSAPFMLNRSATR